MPAPMIAPLPTSSKRFVPAQPDTFSAGREMYRTGKPLAQCTATQAEGWRFEEARGADAYWACMMIDASDSRPVQGGEGW